MKQKLQEYVDYLYKVFQIALEKENSLHSEFHKGKRISVKDTINELCENFELENPFEKENKNENTSEN